jgi:hypothetical protein
MENSYDVRERTWKQQKEEEETSLTTLLKPPPPLAWEEEDPELVNDGKSMLLNPSSH